MEKILFQRPARAATESFQSVLKKRIDTYFIERKISKKGNWALYIKTIVLFILFIGTYISIMQTSHLAVSLLLYSVLGLMVAGMGFNVMHDASHKSYSKNPALNNVIAFLGGDLMGASTFIWNVKHNVLHHTFTNIEGHDDDIAKYPLFRMNEHQPRLWFHKYQHLYAPLLYMVLSLHWSLFNDYSRILNKKVLEKEMKLSTKDYLIFALGKALNLSVMLVIPMLLANVWWHAVLGFVVMHLTTGITLAFVFQMAHVVEGTEFPVPPSMDEWMLHQLQTTANFAMQNKWLSWYVGGLNFQIEHHLFSNISHIHYPALSRIVQKTCREYKITYHAFPTFRKALLSHFSYLRAVGQA